jgi:hypothetical protein
VFRYLDNTNKLCSAAELVRSSSLLAGWCIAPQYLAAYLRTLTRQGYVVERVRGGVSFFGAVDLAQQRRERIRADLRELVLDGLGLR